MACVVQWNFRTARYRWVLLTNVGKAVPLPIGSCKRQNGIRFAVRREAVHKCCSIDAEVVQTTSSGLRAEHPNDRPWQAIAAYPSPETRVARLSRDEVLADWITVDVGWRWTVCVSPLFDRLGETA